MQLVRVPNLLTVPGDPLSGFLLGRLGGVPTPLWWAMPAVASALLLYMAGLVLNDLADLEVDRKERPQRPLPSGRIARRDALSVAVILGGTGLGVAAVAGWAAFLVALLLALMILAYNFALKDIPALGAVSMGCCRGLSLLLGAVAAGWRWPGGGPVAVAAVGLALYIAAVTAIARGETTSLKGKWLPALPMGALVFSFSGLLWFVRADTWFLIPSLAALAWTGRWTMQLLREASPASVQAAVGGLIRGLLLVQASFLSIAGMPGLVAAIALLGLWPVNRWLCRSYYAT